MKKVRIYFVAYTSATVDVPDDFDIDSDDIDWDEAYEKVRSEQPDWVVDDDEAPVIEND